MTTVSELFDADSGTWKIDTVRNNFISPEAEAIFNIPLRRMGGDYTWAWSAEKTRIHTIKSAYQTLMIRNEHLALKEGLVIESSKMKKQLWTRLYGDMYHALIQCTHAKCFWREAREWMDIKLPYLHGLTWSRDILYDPHFDVADRTKIITVMWAIWTYRNNITHDKESMDPVQSL
ncbi:alanyl-trna synthetase [Hordeum vulgare]|nr:alanyl-trna synthetase [Hordeum vulgare]